MARPLLSQGMILGIVLVEDVSRLHNKLITIWRAHKPAAGERNDELGRRAIVPGVISELLRHDGVDHLELFGRKAANVLDG
eukprot:scaffold168394_cov31-Tisochrysis_lutea.AAC.3